MPHFLPYIETFVAATLAPLGTFLREKDGIMKPRRGVLDSTLHGSPTRPTTLYFGGFSRPYASAARANLTPQQNELFLCFCHQRPDHSSAIRSELLQTSAESSAGEFKFAVTEIRLQTRNHAKTWPRTYNRGLGTMRPLSLESSASSPRLPAVDPLTNQIRILPAL